MTLARTPDAPPGLAERLHGLTHTIATDPNAPPELRALCRVLNAVLSGEHAPDTSALPPRMGGQGARDAGGVVERIVIFALRIGLKEPMLGQKTASTVCSTAV